MARAVRPAAYPEEAPARSGRWQRSQRAERRLQAVTVLESAAPANCALRHPAPAGRQPGLPAAERVWGDERRPGLQAQRQRELRLEERSEDADCFARPSRAARSEARLAAARAKDDCSPPARRELWR